MNAEVLTGSAGWDAIGAYHEMLVTPVEAALWHQELGVQKEQCLSLMLLAVCDTFRRLVLPFEALPYQTFRLLHGSEQEALQLAKSLKQKHCRCSRCRDPLFSEVREVANNGIFIFWTE